MPTSWENYANDRQGRTLAEIRTLEFEVAIASWRMRDDGFYTCASGRSFCCRRFDSELADSQSIIGENLEYSFIAHKLTCFLEFWRLH